MRDQIGRYELRRELGRGGMATVYLAFDPRFRRQVAIKVLPRQFTHDPRYLARFEQEAQTIATLEHAAIVPVYDFGEQDDAPYLVMRYMSGGTLGGRLQGEPLSLEDIAAALDRLAPALDYAHKVGVIHRDLKPANILFDHQGSPYLADFGIARLAEASQTMTMIGTPAYMSPEQVESQVKLDGRSDIYALGVMLYELLAGKQPYTAETPTGQMLMHITMPVPDIMDSGRDLLPGTQVVIEKAMAKDREERYQSAAELATAVNDLLAAENSVEAGLMATAVAAEVVTSQGTAVVPDEPPAREDPQIESAFAAGSVVPLVEAGDEGGGLPGWVWWLGALALVAIAVFGIRAIIGSGAGEEPVAVPAAATVEEAASVAIAEATATEVSEAEEEPIADTATPLLDVELGAHWVRPADRMTMIHIPAGTFAMGSKDGPDNETPVHEVSLDAFWIDRTEVTNARYALCVNDGGCGPAPFVDDVNYNGENYPIVGISWFDAEAYCEWADARLPTEAEWEYAARGPQGNEYPWGNEEPVCDLAQFADCSGETIQAGSLPDGASWAGVLDMSGNVREWVNDWYDSDYYANSPELNPHGPGSGESKVLRGGAWDFTGVDYLRGASRELDSLGVSNVAVGFRCVVALDSSDEGMPRDIDDEAIPVEEAAPVEGETAAGEGVVSEEEPTDGVITPPLDAELGEHWVRPTDDMTMVYVPEGSFPMGSEDGSVDETPVHEVSLDAFWIDRTEVTNAHYLLCVSDGNCEASRYVYDTRYNGDDYPVVGVSWNEAEAYCEWADARLPTEAEWEYAARGPKGNKYPWGSAEPNCELAQFPACGGRTVPAGSLPDGESWAGTLDMSGNVWEWVDDTYNKYANSLANIPPGPGSGVRKVLRGGSWGYIENSLLGANRYFDNPVNRFDDYGFRCVVPPGN